MHGVHIFMKVSVLVITYNHEKFIAQALDSVLMQETDFIYEIIVGEDCSSDQTRKIVLAYGEKYPDKVRLLLPEQNLGMMYNFITTYRACRGQYIAILEGDDYWTSDRKLQKQVDFLDSHQDCTACFHNVNVVYESDSKKKPSVSSSQVEAIFYPQGCGLQALHSYMFDDVSERGIRRLPGVVSFNADGRLAFACPARGKGIDRIHRRTAGNIQAP